MIECVGAAVRHRDGESVEIQIDDRAASPGVPAFVVMTEHGRRPLWPFVHSVSMWPGTASGTTAYWCRFPRTADWRRRAVCGYGFAS